MFTVKSITVGTCIACGKKEIECFEVESSTQTVSGLFCLPNFKRQVKILTANSTPPLATPSASSSPSFASDNISSR